MTAVKTDMEDRAMPETFMVTEEAFNERDWGRGPTPTYRVDVVARFFFGMSASWLRLKLKADEEHPATWFVNPDGSRMEFRRLDPMKGTSARVFTLADIEPMAWSLYRLGAFGPVRLAKILRVVEAQAVMYGFVNVEGYPEEDDPA
jgi:hypothetical protein